MKNLVFVVHKHEATTLHFDLRLEAGGVMPSWAIPKGPTLDPAQKRLAIKTPDHPLAYRKFEGTIPEGHYGAGPVEIWDEGIYFPEVETGREQREQIKEKNAGEKIVAEAIKKGEIKFFLEGKKLKGSFALIKMKKPIGNQKDAWLLIKHRDKFVKENFKAKEIP